MLPGLRSTRHVPWPEEGLQQRPATRALAQVDALKVSMKEGVDEDGVYTVLVLDGDLNGMDHARPLTGERRVGHSCAHQQDAAVSKPGMHWPFLPNFF